MMYKFQSRVLRENQFDIYTYVQQKYDNFAEQVEACRMFDKEPLRTLSFVRSYFEENEIKQIRFLNNIMNDNLIVIESGKRNSGKTVLNLWIAENLYNNGFHVFYINSDMDLPDFITEVSYNPTMPYIEIIQMFYPEVVDLETYQEVIDYLRRNKKKSGKIIIFHDECHKDLPKNVSRTDGDLLRMYWAEVRKLFFRHSILYTSQTLSGIPLQLFNYADMQLYKNFNPWQMTMDRKEVIGEIGMFVPSRVQDTLCIFDDVMIFENPKPEFMSK